jgi:hypothetical protein
MELKTTCAVGHAVDSVDTPRPWNDAWCRFRDLGAGRVVSDAVGR